MAVDDDDLELDEEKVAPKKKSGGGLVKIILIVVVVLLVIVISIGGTMFATGAFSDKGSDNDTAVTEEKKEEKKEAEDMASKEVFYETLNPPFVVNFEDKNYVRFLQVSVDVMTESQPAIENVKKHMPVIRNNIVLILGEVTYADISTREGKEGLRTRILEDIQKVLKKRAGDESVKELFFTSFVMQ